MLRTGKSNLENSQGNEMRFGILKDIKRGTQFTEQSISKKL